MTDTMAPPTDVATQIADALGETAPEPRARIARAVRILGAERVSAFADQAREIEQGEGIMTADGSRRRTLGGVFFHIMKAGIAREERWIVFPKPPHKKGGTGAKGQPAAEPTFDWFTDDATWQGIVEELQSAVGEATTVKATVIGRPAKIEQRDQTVLVGLRSAKVPAFPKGVPTPAAGTPYMVLIAAKQWNKVAAAIQDPDDSLIVEGYPTLDPRFPKGITVHVTSVTTKHLQAAKREAQQAPAK